MRNEIVNKISKVVTGILEASGDIAACARILASVVDAPRREQHLEIAIAHITRVINADLVSGGRRSEISSRSPITGLHDLQYIPSCVNCKRGKRSPLLDGECTTTKYEESGDGYGHYPIG